MYQKVSVIFVLLIVIMTNFKCTLISEHVRYIMLLTLSDLQMRPPLCSSSSYNVIYNNIINTTHQSTLLELLPDMYVCLSLYVGKHSTCSVHACT